MIKFKSKIAMTMSILLLSCSSPNGGTTATEQYSFSNKLVTENLDKVWEVWTDVEKWYIWDTELEYSRLNGKFELNAKGVLKAKESSETTFYISDYKYKEYYEITIDLPLSVMKIRRSFSKEDSKNFFTHKISFEGFSSPVLYYILGEKYKKILPPVMNNIKKISEK